MIEIRIYQNTFNKLCCNNSVSQLIPKYIKWVYDKETYINVYVDNFIMNMVDPNKYNIAWLIEPRPIIPNIYNYISYNYDKFDIIYTFDNELLKINKKFILMEFGGTWIKKKDHKIYNKSKLISMISTRKNLTLSHNFRQQVENEVIDIVDIFGFGINPVKYKLTALKEYMYSIVVENNNENNHYFSEKLLDVLLTGTIPIYRGTNKIKNYFDTNGMILFDTIDELKYKLSNVNKLKYNEMLPFIKKNFELSKKYKVIEDNIYKKHLKNI